MLRDADLSLANWLGTVLPPGTGVRFDAPRADWEARGSGSAFVSLFLWDIRRDGREQPTSGWSEVRDGDGRLLGRQLAARYYRISYAVTAWADPPGAGDETSRRALDEHSLLGLLIDACTTADTIADDHLTGALAATGLPTFVRCAGDEPGRSTQGLWPGFGIAPRAHLVLDLVAATVPPMATGLAPAPREIVLGASRLPAPAAGRPGVATSSGSAPSGTEPAGAPVSVRRWERSTVTERAARPVPAPPRS
ncbi:Pvc16 family protein [Streptacidiphilus sp. EB129]|uniref:Pvc16 family protein n=1 Tax=Streptacidiphilus sp. EB129 TaxID=3156262 RepID=UPI0035124A40